MATSSTILRLLTLPAPASSDTSAAPSSQGSKSRSSSEAGLTGNLFSNLLKRRDQSGNDSDASSRPRRARDTETASSSSASIAAGTASSNDSDDVAHNSGESHAAAIDGHGNHAKSSDASDKTDDRDKGDDAAKDDGKDMDVAASADAAAEPEKASTERDADSVDVQGADVSDPTKDPTTEALALGLLVGQAVPQPQPPIAGFSGAAAIAAPAIQVNAKASSSDALAKQVDAALAAEAALPDEVADTSATVALPEKFAALLAGLQKNGTPAETKDGIDPALALLLSQNGPEQKLPQTEAPLDPAALLSKLTAVKQTPAAKVEDAKTALADLPDASAAENAAMAATLAGNTDAANQPRRLGKISPNLKEVKDDSADAATNIQPAAEVKTTATAEAKMPAIPVLNPLRATAETASSEGEEAVDGITLAPGISASAAGDTRATAGTPGMNTQGSFAASLADAQAADGKGPTLATPANQIVAQIASLPKQKGTQFTLQLNPGDLGVVDVVMDFHKNGHVQLTIQAQTQDALDFLQRDARSLEKNLQDLGLKTDSGSLNFSLRQDSQSQQQAAFGQDGQGGGQSGRTNMRGNAARLSKEEPVSLGQVIYRAPRNDGGLDIQV